MNDWGIEHMIRCSKCNGMPNENDVIGWKCNSCGKAFQVKKEQLHNILLKKEANPEKSLCKCPSCENIIDDGKENIAWKCSCGHVTVGKLDDFKEDGKIEKREDKEEVVPDVPTGNLINCPECGKEISSKAKKCVHCGMVFVEEKAITKICADCGKEVASDATECPFCGCPFEEQGLQKVDTIIKSKVVKKNFTKMVIPIALLALVVVIGGVIYNIKVVKPKKVAAQNKATYEEAIDLLEKGKYEEGNELLLTIPDYMDVGTILEQIKWETYTYSCVNQFKQYLKNPDSFTLYEVAFYLDDEAHGVYASLLGEVDFSYPAIIFRSGAQNGFGGNTTGYELFYYIKDSGYTYVASCDYLDEDEYYDDDGELKDKDDGAMEVMLCMEINKIKNESEEVGTVDINRIKTVLKNDAYSTVKIIE